ncbi:MAG: phosphotransferase family protein, partial [Oscillospiraceae bacterium]|nr:phosphotransferase family protein [Oscillospiraceae bacterium]
MSRFEFVSKEPVEKGWSGDKKYCAKTADGQKYLLRISPAEQYERKKSEYEMMLRVAELSVPMCEALEFDTCDEGV